MVLMSTKPSLVNDFVKNKDSSSKYIIVLWDLSRRNIRAMQNEKQVQFFLDHAPHMEPTTLRERWLAFLTEIYDNPNAKQLLAPIIEYCDTQISMAI